jgi:hypothetical protein
MRQCIIPLSRKLRHIEKRIFGTNNCKCLIFHNFCSEQKYIKILVENLNRRQLLRGLTLDEIVRDC